MKAFRGRFNAAGGGYDYEQDRLNDDLIEAAKKGNIKTVRRLVEKGADINAREGFAMAAAAEYGHMHIVEWFHKRGVDEHEDFDAAFAMRGAIESGHAHIVRYLIEVCGFDVNADDGKALQTAASSGHEDLVALLLEKGADIHADDEQALRSAAENGHTDVAKLLVQHGANVRADDDDALTSAVYDDNLELAKFLIEQGADFKSIEKTWWYDADDPGDTVTALKDWMEAHKDAPGETPRNRPGGNRP